MWDFKEVKQELRKQCWLAVPMILTNMLGFAIQLVSVMFVGHLDELALSSASIAASIANVTGCSLLIGMGCALETLCGQAYGAKQYSLLGLYLQRALFVLNATGIPLAFAWANMEYILLALGQDAAISKKAGEYTLWLIPCLFAYATAQPLVKFLQAQSIVIPLLLSLAFTFCCHIPMCWFLVYKTGLESRGAALATSISNWIYALLLATYVALAPSCKKTRTSFSIKVLNDLKGFIKLAVPSALMICLEWWSYEALVLLSGLLPNPELETSAISICYNTAAFAFMVPSGLGAMASTRVANELGAGRPDAARRAVFVAAMIASCDAVVACTLFISLRNVVGMAYSREKEVVMYISKMVPVLAASTVLDSIQGLLSGIARGCGWQRAGAYINLASYYGVGLPLAFVMAFVFHVKAEGLWMGISTGAIVQLIALVAITWKTNWETEEVESCMGVLEYGPELLTLQVSSLHINVPPPNLNSQPHGYDQQLGYNSWGIWWHIKLLLEYAWGRMNKSHFFCIKFEATKVYSAMEALTQALLDIVQQSKALQSKLCRLCAVPLGLSIFIKILHFFFIQSNMQAPEAHPGAIFIEAVNTWLEVHMGGLDGYIAHQF